MKAILAKSAEADSRKIEALSKEKTTSTEVIQPKVKIYKKVLLVVKNFFKMKIPSGYRKTKNKVSQLGLTAIKFLSRVFLGKRPTTIVAADLKPKNSINDGSSHLESSPNSTNE